MRRVRCWFFAEYSYFSLSLAKMGLSYNWEADAGALPDPWAPPFERMDVWAQERLSAWTLERRRLLTAANITILYNGEDPHCHKPSPDVSHDTWPGMTFAYITNIGRKRLCVTLYSFGQSNHEDTDCFREYTYYARYAEFKGKTSRKC